ncbi:hypothetical protein PXJ20_02145 [Paraburkholderia sp. A1RI_3L]|uniref:gp53-like domain-containing protein n=1 Tax=Paraburkholderia TaxID=1822464 RepID=UPI003B7A19DB
MSYLEEKPEWAEGIRQIEDSDSVEGGPDGVDNIAPRQLASRTSWLRRVLQFGRTTWAPDTGTKNNIVANLSPAVTELLDGMEANFRVAFTNDGACTFTPNGAAGSVIPKLPLYGGDHADLDAGDLPAGAQVRAQLNKALNVADGGAWVIKSVSGGMARTLTPPVGDMSTRVANMAALFAATDGFQTVDVAGKTDTLLTAAQYGVAMLRLTGELTGNKSVLLPKQPGQWTVENATTGNYNLNAAVTGGGGSYVVVPAGQPVVICSDGRNVKFTSTVGPATEASQGAAKLATQAQTNAGTDDTTIVTPKKLRAGFSVSLGVIGYIAFPTWLGGLIIQWGVLSDTSWTAGAFRTINYPVAFPAACLEHTAVIANSAGTMGYLNTNQLSASQLQMLVSYTGAATVRWIAVGY